MVISSRIGKLGANLRCLLQTNTINNNNLSQSLLLAYVLPEYLRRVDPWRGDPKGSTTLNYYLK